jgi:hypothetical protein
MVKECATCKWWKNNLCMNPMNDIIYDHFNQSSGDVIKNIRRAMPVGPKSICEEYSRKKIVTRPEEVGEY